MALRHAESKWLGEDVQHALETPDTGYEEPHLGSTRPPGTLTSTIRSEVYQELQDMLYPERAKLARKVSLCNRVPRPTCVMKTSVEEVVTMGALRDAVDTMDGFNRVSEPID
jgi:hypothetical protein